MYRWTRTAALALVPVALAGCARQTPAPAASKPPEVLVGLPLTRQVTDYEVFTGRVESSARVEVRARMTGYLEKVNFRDGDLVAEGAVLFVIDPKPAQAEFTRAEASLAQAQNEAAQPDDWTSWWQHGGFDHVERFDDRVRLFATRLSEGRHVFSYIARATTAGTFRTAPTHAEEMYEPEVFGRTATAVVEVKK